MSKKHRLVYMGTPDFSVKPLRALQSAGHNIVAVFTQPDRPAGRGKVMRQPEVKEAALALGLPVYQPTTLQDGRVAGMLASLRPDVIVVAAYAQLLPAEILGIPTFGCKNIHASLLPKYRGGAPIQWAIARGEDKSGITIMQMDAGLDTGDIILQASIGIGGDETSGSLTKRLSALGAEMIVECLALDDLGESRRSTQRHQEATYARNLRKSDGLLNWTSSAKSIHDRIRAFNPWPGAYAFLGNLRVSIQSSSLTEQTTGLPPGHIKMAEGKLLVGTGDLGLQIKELTPAGKRSMDGQSFAKGYLTRLSPQYHRFSRE